MRVLLPLPVTVRASPGAGMSLRLRPSASAMRRPRAVEQAEHRGVARDDPGLARFAGAQFGVGDALGSRRSASGFGKVRGSLGVRTAVSAPTLPLPLRSRKRANERAPASPRISERLPAPSPRRAAMKARTSAGVSLAKLLERWRAAQMLGEKVEELADVAAHRLPASWATCAARRRESSASGRFRRSTSGAGRRGLRHGGRQREHALPSPFLKRAESARPKRL